MQRIVGNFDLVSGQVSWPHPVHSRATGITPLSCAFVKPIIAGTDLGSSDTKRPAEWIPRGTSSVSTRFLSADWLDGTLSFWVSGSAAGIGGYRRA
jgi:hypothetical protein